MRLSGERATRHNAVIRQVAAWCLHYPDEHLRRNLTLLQQSVGELGDREPAAQLGTTLEYLRRTPAEAAERHYVEVFDTRPRRSLYLTWYVHGDTRLRGGALADLAGLYRMHGYQLRDGELPDYLPALLEFTATAGSRAGRDGERVLQGFRSAIELLLRKLNDIDTPYAGAAHAVLATIPPTERPVSLTDRPVEQVGRDPLARRRVPKGT